MRITERRLRRIIRSVIKESAQSDNLLEDYQSKLSTMSIKYDYCDNSYADETSCGFIVNGEEIEFEGMIFPNPEFVLDSLLYRIFPEVEDLEDSDLEEKIVREIEKKLGKDQLDKFYSDLGYSREEAGQYRTREFGKDDEYNPY